MDTAGITYAVVRDVIFQNEIDASVYRINLNGIPHVILIGEQELPKPVAREISDIFDDGQPTTVPPEVTGVLVDRRRELKIPGVVWERRGG